MQMFDAAHIHTWCCSCAETAAINEQKILDIERQAEEVCIALKHPNLQQQTAAAEMQALNMNEAMAAMYLNLKQLEKEEEQWEKKGEEKKKGEGWKVVKKAMLLNSLWKVIEN